MKCNLIFRSVFIFGTTILCAAFSENVASASVSNRVDEVNIFNDGSCNSDRLAVYKVVLHTYWTRDLFPKHYPDWRPQAQWTKTFGELIFFYFRFKQLNVANVFILFLEGKIAMRSLKTNCCVYIILKKGGGGCIVRIILLTLMF